MIGRTLSLYLAGRFARAVIAAFMLVFVLIYAVDLVELLRRSGDSQRASGILMAGLSFLRTPTVAEQALPFAVLFGSMIAFLNLSRKMELVVARAAGLSVWQFLTPPLAVIVLMGVLSVVAYNPASTWMKQKADEIESKVFGGPATGTIGMWIRQKSIDGQAVIRAVGRSLGGAEFNGIQVFNFDDQGNFVERLEADVGRVTRWLLGIARCHSGDVRVSKPSESPPTSWRQISIAERSPRRSWRPKPCRFGNCPGLPNRLRARDWIPRLTY